MNRTEKDTVEVSGYAYAKERDKFKDVIKTKTVARQIGKEVSDLMELLKKQSEDNKPILYLGKNVAKVILPAARFDEMCKEIAQRDAKTEACEIIIKKYVMLMLLELCDTAEQYNAHMQIEQHMLTKEEFDTIKEAINETRNIPDAR